MDSPKASISQENIKNQALGLRGFVLKIKAKISTMTRQNFWDSNMSLWNKISTIINVIFYKFCLGMDPLSFRGHLI